MLEYNWTRLLNKRMYAVTIYFFTFQYLKNYAFYLKKRRPQFFNLYEALFICEKLTADNDADLS